MTVRAFKIGDIQVRIKRPIKQKGIIQVKARKTTLMFSFPNPMLKEGETPNEQLSRLSLESTDYDSNVFTDDMIKKIKELIIIWFGYSPTGRNSYPKHRK